MTTIVKSHYIVTPYYDEIIKDTTFPLWYLNQKYHHTPYQFFVLKTRLRPYVPSEYYIGLGHERYFGQMQYTILFSSNGAIVPLTQLEADKYQQHVNNIIQHYPTYCTLIYYKQPLYSSTYNTTIPTVWVTSVLPYVYPMVPGNTIFVDGQILIDLEPKSDAKGGYNIKEEMISNFKDSNNNDIYDIIYTQIQNKFVDRLYELYKKGTVVASAERDADVIEKWRLVPLLNTNNDTQLYTTTWIDQRVTGNITEFLMDRLHNYPVLLPNQPIKKHINVDSYGKLTKILN